ncbi:hypothetical protein B296_00050219, partial [Ensete ventricosum]
VNSGTNLGDLAERVNSGSNPGDLAERVNSGTNPGDLAEKVNSGTNPGDLVEKANSGTNPRDSVEKANSGTNPGDSVEKVNSDTNPGDLAERVNSGTNPGDLAERVNSDTNPGDLAERVNSGTNPGDLAEKVNSVTNPGDLAEVADHDLDMAVTKGSLAVIRGRYSIPAEFGLHVPQPEQHPYSSDAPGMCFSVDALEAGLRFPLHPLIEECLRWWRISPSQVAPNSWRNLVVFLGECRGAGIIPTWDLFMACFRLCKSRDDYYLTARVDFRVNGAPSNNKGWKSGYLFVSDRMDLGELCGMPKVSGGKAPSTRTTAWEAPKASSKRPVDAPAEQADDPAR